MYHKAQSDDFYIKSQDHTGTEALKKRARSKYMTRAFMLSLIKACPDSPLLKKYRNSFYCANQLEQTSFKHFNFETGKDEIKNRITSKYCKNRYCLVCNRIRTGYYINTYSEALQDWDLHFLTLTLRNVKNEELIKTYDSMNNLLAKIKKNVRQRKDISSTKHPVRGIRKLETTYNSVFNDYHPHYHIILDSEYIGKLFRELWIEYAKDFGFVVDENFQMLQKADITTTKEIFKYFTKLISKDKNGNTHFNPYAIDNIFTSLGTKKRNIIEPFGFKIPNKKMTDKDWEILDTKLEEKNSETEDYQVFEWEQEIHDWINKQTGELKSGYEPDEKFKKFVESI